MAAAATKNGTKRSRAMENELLRKAARRQFPDAPGRIIVVQTRKLAKLARAGRLRLPNDPRTP